MYPLVLNEPIFFSNVEAFRARIQKPKFILYPSQQFIFLMKVPKGHIWATLGNFGLSWCSFLRVHSKVQAPYPKSNNKQSKYIDILVVMGRKTIQGAHFDHIGCYVLKKTTNEPIWIILVWLFLKLCLF